MLLLRTDSSGNTKWYKTFHYGTHTLCTGYSVIETSDKGFALGGFMYTIGHPETGNSVIVKTDSSGNQEWVKFLGGPYLDNTAMLSRSPDGNIIMGTAYGEAMSGNNLISRIYIAKLDIAGNIIWQHKYAESRVFNFLINIRTLEDGSVIACGSIYDQYIYHGWILKVDMNGDSIWYREKRLLPGENSLHYLYDIIPTSDNGFLTCGDAIPISPDTGIRSAWVIKLDSIGCEWAGCDTTVGVKEHGGMEVGGHGELYLWPNPAGSVIHGRLSMDDGRFNRDLTLVIYDIFGRQVQMKKIREGQDEFQINVEGYPPGVYIAILKNGIESVEGRKFIISGTHR